MSGLQQAEELYWRGKFSNALGLLNRLEKHTETSDLERLQGQLLRCRILTHHDIQEAQTLAARIIQESQQVNQPVIHLDTLLVMAEAWLELGKLQTSREHLDEGKEVLFAISNLPADDRTARDATVLRLEGELELYTDSPTRAVETFHQSLTLLEHQQNAPLRAQALTSLGHAYSRLGDYHRSCDVLQQSLGLCEQLQHPYVTAQTLFHLGRTYINKGEHKHAYECF